MPLPKELSDESKWTKSIIATFFAAPKQGSAPFFKLLFNWTDKEYAAARTTVISCLQKNGLVKEGRQSLPHNNMPEWPKRKRAEDDMHAARPDLFTRAHISDPPVRPVWWIPGLLAPDRRSLASIPVYQDNDLSLLPIAYETAGQALISHFWTKELRDHQDKQQQRDVDSSIDTEVYADTIANNGASPNVDCSQKSKSKRQHSRSITPPAPLMSSTYRKAASNHRAVVYVTLDDSDDDKPIQRKIMKLEVDMDTKFPVTPGGPTPNTPSKLKAVRNKPIRYVSLDSDDDKPIQHKKIKTEMNPDVEYGVMPGVPASKPDVQSASATMSARDRKRAKLQLQLEKIEIREQLLELDDEERATL